MKNPIFQTGILSVFTLLLLGCNSGQRTNDTTGYSDEDSSAINQPPAMIADRPKGDTLQIIFPKGGEKLVKGKSYTFEWNGGDSVITIFLVDSSLEAEGASVSLADRLYGIPNKGNYHYTFPKRLKQGTYKVQIGRKMSGYFKVVGKDTTQ